MGSPAAPPRLELPPHGRRSRKLESRARRRCIPESSTSSPTRRTSRRLTGATSGVEVTRAKLAPRALRRHLIGLGLLQRPELRDPLLPQILHEGWLHHRSAIEFCQDPSTKKEIRTVARRGWQSRQLKASGTTRTGKQEARQRPDDRGRRSECAGQSCLVGSPHLAWIWWCVGERFGDESESGKVRAGVLVGSPASPHKQVLSLGAGPDMRRGKKLTGRPNIGG
jgi:hypothetical protein